MTYISLQTKICFFFSFSFSVNEKFELKVACHNRFCFVRSSLQKKNRKRRKHWRRESACEIKNHFGHKMVDDLRLSKMKRKAKAKYNMIKILGNSFHAFDMRMLALRDPSFSTARNVLIRRNENIEISDIQSDWFDLFSLHCRR